MRAGSAFSWAHVGHERGALRWPAHGLRDEIDVVQNALHVGPIDHQDGDSQAAQLGKCLRLVEVVATRDDQVGIQAHDLLDVDGAERRDVGQGLDLGWIVVRVRVRYEAVAEASANRISVVAGVMKRSAGARP